MRRNLVVHLCMLGAALALAVAAAPAGAATRLVDDDGAQCPKAPYRTIQAAIDAAAPRGDVVIVCDGRYREDPVFVHDPYDEPGRGAITIRARRPRRAVVEGDWRVCSSGPATVRDFVVEGSLRVGCTAGADVVVEGNDIRGGTVTMFNGSATIVHNTLTGYRDVGISVGGSNFGLGGSALVDHNTLHGTPGAIGIDVVEGLPRCFGAISATVQNNVVSGNAIGLRTATCVAADFIGNRVTGNVTGVRVGDADVVERNVIRGNSGDGLVVEDVLGRVVRNDARGNGGTDCVLLDGPRPAGWHSNLGLDASPAGLCTPNGK